MLKNLLTQVLFAPARRCLRRVGRSARSWPCRRCRRCRRCRSPSSAPRRVAQFRKIGEVHGGYHSWMVSSRNFMENAIENGWIWARWVPSWSQLIRCCVTKKLTKKSTTTDMVMRAQQRWWQMSQSGNIRGREINNTKLWAKTYRMCHPFFFSVYFYPAWWELYQRIIFMMLGRSNSHHFGCFNISWSFGLVTSDDLSSTMLISSRDATMLGQSWSWILIPIPSLVFPWYVH